MPILYLQVAVAGPFKEGLTYSLDFEGVSDSLVGRRISIPLRKKIVVGMIDAVYETLPVVCEEAKLKAAIAIIDEAPIVSKLLCRLIHFMRNYYHVSLGDAYQTALPALVCQGKPLKARVVRAKTHEDAIAITLNKEQQTVFENLLLHFKHEAVHLVEGVTGSGKTEVYIKCALQVLAEGGSVLILVPEIGLTPQTIERFQNGLGIPILAYHSGLTEAQRRDCWVQVASGKGRVIIGTRSAVFLPCCNLGLIIIDEEHDASYKQHTGVPYSAKSIALMRGKMEKIPVILGSATPSAESYYLAQKGVYFHHILSLRAIAQKQNEITVIDMRRFPKKSGLSRPFVDAMAQHLQQGGQVLVFLNRRGYAPILLCDACGERVKCPACETSYTVHFSPSQLICHHCGRIARVPASCQSCGKEMVMIGQGTQQIEAYLAEKFPEYPLLRLDQDATRKKGSLIEKLAQIKNKEVKIIVGTQMLAKGHDFPDITWVGVVDLDYGFFAPDFRSIERMGQLLTQVAGRAGRGLKAGEVMLQTHVPDHPLLKILLQKGYPAFLMQLLQEREAANWPPFSYLALLRAEARDESFLLQKLNMLKRKMQQEGEFTILGPVPAFLRRKNNMYRAQLLLEARNRNALHHALSKLEELKWEEIGLRFVLDIDPIEIG